jgi:hypothetical protein
VSIFELVIITNVMKKINFVEKPLTQEDSLLPACHNLGLNHVIHSVLPNKGFLIFFEVIYVGAGDDIAAKHAGYSSQFPHGQVPLRK